ncbi:MAG TPA: GntR family transcriptional regulator [Bryobacteraceae bacterium]|nr:GntR family transcriptional regulator [Bryobacteraceae bacterium]
MSAPLLRIDLRPGTPAYRQIADTLRAVLVAGSLRPGEHLPPVRQLALEVGVHFNTVAEAYRILAAEGWLALRRRRGALVLARRPPEAAVDVAETFPRRLREVVAEWRAAGMPQAVIARELRSVADGL